MHEKKCVVREPVLAWHPSFDLEAVEDIAPIELPKVETHTVPKAMAKPLLKVLQPTKSVISTEEQKEEPKAMSLLERIREKERKAKESKTVQRTSTECKELSLLSRAREVIMGISMFFISSKKRVMPFTEVIQQMVTSHAVPLTKADAELYLKMLSEMAPEWMEVTEGAQKLVKVNRTFATSVVMERVQKKRMELKGGSV